MSEAANNPPLGPEMDPYADLPANNMFVRASKGATVPLLILLIIATVGFTLILYDTLAGNLLREGNRERVQGRVERLVPQGASVRIEYSFMAERRKFHRSGDMSEEQGKALKPGSPIEVEYARQMPTVSRLTASGAERSPKAGALLSLGALLAGLWLLVVFGSSWEHLYLFARYYAKTGGLAWIQMLRVLYNVVFTTLVCLLVFLLAGIPISSNTGAYAHLRPWHLAGAAGIIGALVLLIKWTPFGPRRGAFTVSRRCVSRRETHPLEKAIARGDIAATRRALSRGGNPLMPVRLPRRSSIEWMAPAFGAAILRGKRDLVEVFLEYGCDLQMAMDPPYPAGSELPSFPELWTSLNYAIDAMGNGKADLVYVGFFLGRGASVNAPASNCTSPLLHAILGIWRLDIAELLLDSGADPNYADAEGETALHWLAKEDSDDEEPGEAGSTEPFISTMKAFAELLLNYGADINARSHAGQTPLAARRSKNPEMVGDAFWEFLIGNSAVE